MSIGPPNFAENLIDNFPSLLSLAFLATFNPLRDHRPLLGTGVKSKHYPIFFKLGKDINKKIRMY
jgi:hypothetical protein